MNGLDNHYRALLAHYQASIDANQEPEPHTPTHQEKAFIKAYRLCMGNAPQNELEYYFQNQERAQLGTSEEQLAITEQIESWSRIEDAWLLWHEAIEYARGAA
jgi:hypothetical protein